MELEKHMLEDDVTIPIYFTYETEEILDIYYSMEQTSPNQHNKPRSAAEGKSSSVPAVLIMAGRKPLEGGMLAICPPCL